MKLIVSRDRVLPSSISRETFFEKDREGISAPVNQLVSYTLRENDRMGFLPFRLKISNLKRSAPC